MAAPVYHPAARDGAVPEAAPRGRGSGPAGAVLLLVALAVPVMAGAANSDSTYWGPAAAADTTRIVFRQRGLPVWEAAVVYPWRVLTFPIKLAGKGLGAAFVAGERSHFIGHVVDILTPPPRPAGFSPQFSAGGLNGLGAGLTLYDNEFLHPDHRARIGADGNSNGSKRFRLGLLLHEPGPTSVEIGAGYRLRRSARFFGLGPDSDVDDESYFGLETSWGGVGLNHRLGRRASLQFTALATTAGTARSAEVVEERIESVFDGRLPFGYSERSDGGSIGADLVLGEPRTHVRPDDEELIRLHLAYFDDWNGGSSPYLSALVSARRYFSLWNQHQTLSLRGVTSWVDPVGNGEIPFQRLNSNHGLERMRGYQDFRFTDRGLMILSAEYRWPIWVTREADRAGLDMLLFTDIGQVFRDADDIALDNLSESWGLGLEFAGARGMLARVELGWSEEEQVIRFGMVSLLEMTVGEIFLGRSLDREP